MSFVKSPRQIRSGVNTIPTPRKSASSTEVRVNVDADKKEENNEAPTWLTIAAGLSSMVDLTAALLMVHKWKTIPSPPENYPAWKFGVIAANLELSWLVYACFLGGALALVVFGAWALYRYPKMRAHGPWSLLFVSLMMFNFNLALFLRLAARTDKGDLFPARAQHGFYAFLVLGGLVSGFSAITATRTKVWRSPVFQSNAVKWALKWILGIGIFGFGISPMISIGFKHPSLGFYLCVVSFTITKFVMVLTFVMNLLGNRKSQPVEGEENRPLLVDQTTAT